MSNLFPNKFSQNQCSDTGMAMTLILLLLGVFTGNQLFYNLAILVLLLNMIYPMIFYPMAILWFGLSNFLGTWVSKVVLTLIYIVFVMPVAFVRKIKGIDSLNLKAWKKDTKSVMIKRDHLYKSEDIKKLF